jgi:hypothetical protein
VNEKYKNVLNENVDNFVQEEEGIIIGNTLTTNVYIVQFDNRKQNIISSYLTLKYINNNNDIDLYNYYQIPIDVEKIE